MITELIAALTLASVPVDTDRRTIVVGWHDELNDSSQWRPLEVDNKPDVFSRTRGEISLRLPQVPSGWPYEYQWSGLTREAIVDIGKYPIMVARVSAIKVSSYAHMDVEELNTEKKAAWVQRSSTLLSPGLSFADLSEGGKKGVRRLQIRLIVGCPNEGGENSFSWVRFVKREDLEFLQKNPDWQRVKREP